MLSADGLRVRRAVKTCLARTLFWTGTDALLGALLDPAQSAVVLGYHRVVEDYRTEAGQSIAAMLITRRMLEEQLDWVGRRFRFVDLDELGRRLERGGDAAGRVAAVTFDDGYRDVYEHAHPLLKRKGIPSAVFVVTDLVGRGELLAHDRLYLALTRAFGVWTNPARGLRALLLGLHIRIPGMESWTGAGWTAESVVVWLLRGLPRGDIQKIIDAVESQVGVDEAAVRRLLPVTWEMLASMHRAGVTIASHTRTHAWLTLEDRGRALDELRDSRHALESRLGVAVRHLAYPDGQFNDETVRQAAAAGYRFAYTTCSHRDPHQPLLSIPRRMLWQNACLDRRGRLSGAILSCQLHGVFGLLRGCEQKHVSLRDDQDRSAA